MSTVIGGYEQCPPGGAADGIVGRLERPKKPESDMITEITAMALYRGGVSYAGETPTAIRPNAMGEGPNYPA